MDDHVEPFVCQGRHEIAGEDFVLSFVGLEGMFANLVPPAKPTLASLVRDIKIVQFVSDRCFLDDSTHPLSKGDGVGRKIKHHRHACLQQRNNMWADRVAETAGVSDIVVKGLQLLQKQVSGPMILADQATDAMLNSRRA